MDTIGKRTLHMPRTHSNYLSFLTLSLLLFGTFVLPDTYAQKPESTPKVETAHKAKGDDPAEAEQPAESLSDAEKVLRIQNIIELDEEKLAQLNKQVKTLEKDFQKVSNQLKDLNDQLDARKSALEQAIEGPETAGTAELNTEIKKIQAEIVLVKKQSELVFQSQKTMREQITVLENKIARDKERLTKLKGIKAEEEREISPEAFPPSQIVSEKAPPLEHPVTRLTNGLQKTESPKIPDEVAMTPAQIEARKEAERRKEAARKAEKAIVEYVERKKVLEEQISLEGTLLDTARKQLENSEAILEKREDDLKEMIAANAPYADLSMIQQEMDGISDKIDKATDEIEERSRHLSQLNRQLQEFQQAELEISQEAERKRREAEAARKRSIWLESPFHPENITRWATTRGPRMLLVAAVMVTLLFAIRLLIGKVADVLVRPGRGIPQERKNRAKTVALSFRSVLSAIVIIGGTLLVLEEGGIDIKTLLGGAAILGLAIAFGAQNLMRDYFNGFLILIEDQYELDDIISVGDITGTVERISMRMTVIRDLEGKAHFIPNGHMKQVTNRTHEWSQAVFEIGVAYKENVDDVMQLLMDLANELRRDPTFGPSIIAEPIMLGVDAFGDAAVKIKFLMKTKPDKMWPVRREMLRRIKNTFDEKGISIPVPHHVILQGEKKKTRNT